MNPKNCPDCGKRGNCTDSRPTDEYVRRRYRCKSCGKGWTTAEVFVHAEATQQHRSVEKALTLQSNERALATFERIATAVREAFK